MNIIEKRVEEIKEDLEFFDDELAKYEYIIDLGKRLEPFKEEDKMPFFTLGSGVYTIESKL